MKHAALPRREIGIRTVFNILGPLTNPAGAGAQVVGVADEALVEKLASVLNGLGCRHVMVVHGEDGLDEITITGKTHVREFKDGRITDYTICPEDFGLERAGLERLRGGDVDENSALLRNILAGARSPRRDVVLMNAAAVILAGDRVSTFEQGIELAAESIDSGQATEKLKQLIRLSQEPGLGYPG